MSAERLESLDISVQGTAASPVLLTTASYYGTLAAARCYGRAGIPVTVGEEEVLAVARWSRYVNRTTRCPPIHDAEAYVEWLAAFGAENPGTFLYPTSDEHAWLFSLYRDRLARHFRMYQPDAAAVYTLLNKRLLYAACARLGISTPDTWWPETDEELEKLSQTLAWPVLIKPQTQLFFESHSKGRKVDDAAALEARYAEFIARNRYGDFMLRHDPTVVRPMIQAYRPEAAENTYSLTGFVDASGALSTFRGAVKVLQRPRKLGIGLCFEEAPVNAALAKKVAALCQQIGYFGVFEIEFIQTGDDFLLIDFNPRFYSQMAFEVDRGMPLPLLAWTAARGDRAALEEAVARSNAWRSSGDRGYCHRFIFEVMLRGQKLSGALSPEEVRHWRRWFEARRAHLTDAVLDEEDRIPGMVDWATHLLRYARHPRAFFHTMILDRV